MEKDYEVIFVDSSKQKIGSLLPRKGVKGIFVLPKIKFSLIKKNILDGDTIENYLLNELREINLDRRSCFEDLEFYFLNFSGYEHFKCRGGNNLNNNISSGYMNLVNDISKLIAKINQDYNSNYYIEATQVLTQFERDLGI